MIRPPPRSPLFPYTTLSRSTSSPASGGKRGRPPASPTRASSACTTRSEEHTSELQSHVNLVCRLLLEKKKKTTDWQHHEDSVRIYCVLEPGLRLVMIWSAPH